MQRWEQEFGLPVRRPNGIQHKSAVIAHTSDLDAWLVSHWSMRDNKNSKNATLSEKTDELVQRAQQLGDAHSPLLHQ